MQSRVDRIPHVLFLNTRSALGADVAVHWMLVRNLEPMRCRITVVTNSRSVNAALTQKILQSVPGLHLITLNLGYELTGRGQVIKLLSTAGNVGALTYAMARLTWLVWTQQVDIIHSTDRPRDALVSTLLARLTRRINVLHIHIKWYPQIGRITNWALRRCDAVLAISRFVCRSLREGSVPEQKIYTVLNATDPTVFDPARCPRGVVRMRFGLEPDTPLIGIVARLIVWKGHMELLEALVRVKEAIPNVRLAIVGHTDSRAASDPTSYEAQVRRRIEERGLQDHILWTGWQEEMQPILADLDVLAAPSWEEPFGLAVTESMAMERPIIGFDSGALPEIITHGVEGLLVPPKDIEALAKALIALLNDPERRVEMGRRGRERVLRDFMPQRQAAEVERLYMRLLHVGRGEQQGAPSG